MSRATSNPPAKDKMRPLSALPVVVVLILISILAAACANDSTPAVAPPEVASAAPQPVATGPSGSATSSPEPQNVPPLMATLAEILPTRTPMPTATPDAVTKGIERSFRKLGLAEKTVLRLEYADWTNLGLSLLYVLAGYLIGTGLVRWLLPRLVRRTKTVLDDRMLQACGNQLRWLIVLFVVRYATNRLLFIGGDAKRFLADIYFLLQLLLITAILWRLIILAAELARELAETAGHRKRAESLIMLLVWSLRLILIIIVAWLLLAHFTVNVTGIAIVLGVIGLTLSIASRDVLADIVAGAIILVDQPYRVGDRLELTGIDSWGDVVAIGMRSTRILTVNNRMVILPNSQIGKNQIINYSYPDSSFNDTGAVAVAYDNDADQIVKVLSDAIRCVDGVEKERVVEVQLMELTENQMVFRITWWVASYRDRFPVHDRVNRAVMQALKGAGVVLPYRTGKVGVAISRPDERYVDEVGQTA